MSPAAAAREVAETLAQRSRSLVHTEPDRARVAAMVSEAFQDFAAILRADRCSDDAGCICGCRLPVDERPI